MAGFVRQDSRITTHPLPGDSGPMILMELANEQVHRLQEEQVRWRKEHRTASSPLNPTPRANRHL